MNVVVDTNVVASAIFFGGKPKEIIDLIMKDKVYAYASKEILDHIQPIFLQKTYE